MTDHLKGFREKKQLVKTAKGRKISSTNWINRHINDTFVQLAKKQGYRSRAAFKLIDIIEKFNLINKCKHIVDLGCAPGGWLQILKQKAPKANIFGIDLQVTAPIEGITILQGDFLEEEAFDKLEKLCVEKVDLIVSDMAASASGYQDIDHLRNMALVDLAVEFAELHLSNGGNFVSKIIRGREDEALTKKLQKMFSKVKLYKPKASYKDSSEIYIIALNFNKKNFN